MVFKVISINECIIVFFVCLLFVDFQAGVFLCVRQHVHYLLCNQRRKKQQKCRTPSQQCIYFCSYLCSSIHIIIVISNKIIFCNAMVNTKVFFVANSIRCNVCFKLFVSFWLNLFELAVGYWP